VGVPFPDSKSDADTGSDSRSGSDTGSRSGSDTGSRSGSDTDTDTGARSDFGSDAYSRSGPKSVKPRNAFEPAPDCRVLRPMDVKVRTPAVPLTVFGLLRVTGVGDREVARLASLQRGLVHRHQLRAAGITRDKLATRVHDGRLTRVLYDVFAVGPVVPRVEYVMETAAAMQYVGCGVLSHFSAAKLWNMLDSVGLDGPRRWEESVWITLAGKRASVPKGIHLRSVKDLDRRDLRRCRGLPVTSPARTLLDLAGAVELSELESLLAQTANRALVQESELQDVIARAPASTAGIAKLRLLLDSPTPAADTRSRYERKLRALIAAAELPQPLSNVKLCGYTVDYHWPGHRLVLEFDGWRFHSGRRSFESDRLRDQRLLASGQRVMRATYRHVDFTPFALIARLAAALAHGWRV
jgi:very-short-patch-repair endonuclease